LRVVKTASEEHRLVIGAFSRKRAKIMRAMKFKNRKNITTTAAIDGICRSFRRHITPKIPAPSFSPASSRREIS